MGYPVGHWEGNTLVVDTIGFNGDFEFYSAPFRIDHAFFFRIYTAQG